MPKFPDFQNSNISVKFGDFRILGKIMIPARGPQTVIEQSYIEHILVILITHKIGSF